MRTSERQERNINTTGYHIAILFIVVAAWSGCSSNISVTEEMSSPEQELTDMAPTDEPQTAETLSNPQQQTVPPAPGKRTTSQSSGQRFSVQADTVDVQRKKKNGSQPPTSISVKASTPKKFYTVEVGAFRLQSNVNRHRTQLAQRFKLPVRVLFDSSISLTRVCVGTFSTRTFALNFMKKMQGQYPADYPDCWVSYWTK